MRKNPHEPFKIDGTFGTPVSYGPHEGHDTNGLGGGNTDCNTPLYPLIVDYAEVIQVSSSTSGYGKLLVYKTMTPRGFRFIRYAHCNEILVSKGEKLDENKPVAKMGSTGNSTACHLHWDIFSKEPPGGNWRWYPKTKAELDEYMIDPQEFINVYKDYKPIMPEKTYTESEMAAVRLERDKNWNLYQEAKADAEKFKSEAENRKRDLELFIEDLAKRLFLPATSDKADVIGAVDRLLEVEDQLNQAKKQLTQDEKKHELEVGELKLEIDKLRAGLQEAQNTNNKLLQRVDDLEVRIEAQKEAKEMTTRFNKFIEGLLVFFKRK